MTNPMKYQIVGADGKTIVEDLITSVKDVSQAFADIDWQEQLDTEIKQGAAGNNEWLAHLYIELGNGETLLLMPSPSGLSGQVSLTRETTKYMLFKEKKIVSTDFNRVEIKHTHDLIKDFILQNHENIFTMIGNSHE